MALITLNPTNHETPDTGQGGLAVTGDTNTGHGSTTALAQGASSTVDKTIRWFSFTALAGQIQSVTLKVDWSRSGTTSDAFTATSNTFKIEYSTNGSGGPWTALRNETNFTTLDSGTDSASISPSIPIDNIQVRNLLHAEKIGGESCGVTATIANIKLEVVTVDGAVIAMM